MHDRDLSNPAAPSARAVWRRWTDRALVAGFAALLATAVITLLAIAVRGPDRVVVPSLDQARSAFAAAGFSVHQFQLARMLIGGLTGLTLAVAAAVLFRQRRGQPVAALLSFGLLTLSIGTYGFLIFGVPLLGVGFALVTVGWSLFTLALMVFPDGRFVPSWLRWAGLALVVLSPLGMVGVSQWAPVGVGFLLLAVAALLLRYRRLPAGVERQQIRWALFGFAAGAVFIIPAATLEQLVARGELPPAQWAWAMVIYLLIFLPLSHLVIAGGLLVSLLKFRLYDADRVISRSVSYSILTLVLLGVFAGTEKVIELLGHEWFHEELGVLAGGLGAALAAVMFVPLHHRLGHWAERKFQKQLMRLRTGLPALVGDLRETAPAQRIAAATLDSVTSGVRASRAVVVMDGAVIDARGIAADEAEQWRQRWLPAAQDGFDIDRADPLFPLRVPLEADGHGRVGWLLLGPRPDGSFYGKDEREALAGIADPVARALEIAARREAREAEDRAQWRGQHALNRKLLETLTSLDAKLGQIVPAAAPAPKRNGRSRRAAKPPLAAG